MIQLKTGALAKTKPSGSMLNKMFDLIIYILRFENETTYSITDLSSPFYLFFKGLDNFQRVPCGTSNYKREDLCHEDRKTFQYLRIC